MSRRPSFRLVAAVAVVVLIVFVSIGVIRKAFLETPSRPASAPTTSSAQTASGPVVSDTAAAPTQIPQGTGKFVAAVVPQAAAVIAAATLEAARSTVVGWVAGTPAMLQMGPIEFHQTLTSHLSTAAVASGKIASTEAARAKAGSREQVDVSQLPMTDSPLTITGTLVDASHATVSVWIAWIVATTPASSPQVHFQTQTFGLVYEQDGWRIDTLTETEGPTPVSVDGQAPTGVDGFVTVAGWVPAVFAGQAVGS